MGGEETGSTETNGVLVAAPLRRHSFRAKGIMEKQSHLKGAIVRWSGAWVTKRSSKRSIEEREPLGFEWMRNVPLIVMHASCLGVLWVGWSGTAVAVAAALYGIRMFAITGFYHRYFSHRTFKTSRWGQFLFALLGTCAVQRGPLWWAAHHRHHHRYSDQEKDTHSPRRYGFLWSHMGWFSARANFATNLHAVADLAKFPELRFLDRCDVLIAILLAVCLFLLGAALALLIPRLGTNGPQLLIWGFFISTVILYHGTYSINSIAHKIGRKRYDTQDESGNSFLLALVTFGEGWHNNHHFYPASARQGFYWWEIDLTYYTLVLLSWTGLIWDLRPVPQHIRDARRVNMVAAA